MLGIAAIAAGVFLIGGYIWYVAIVSRRNKAQEAFSGIDVQLKKRHDLIPNILKVARRFMEHEKSLIEEVTRLRAKAVEQEGARAAEAGEKFEIERRLQAGLGRLMVAVENYPDLKSDAHMLEAQRSLNEVEANIAAARRFYNAAVTSLRNAIQIFPGTVIARFAGVGNMPLFETGDTERGPVDADAWLGR